MKTTSILLALFATTLVSFAGNAPDDRAAFAQIKSLAGTWRGHTDCMGGGPETVKYKVVSAGSTVMETQMPGTKMEMISMYHLDRGGNLVMKHYCAAGNQPQMAYDRKQSSPGTLVMKFAGGDVNARRDMHVHNAVIHLIGKNRIESDWTGWKDGKPMMTSHMSLKRAS